MSEHDHDHELANKQAHDHESANEHNHAHTHSAAGKTLLLALALTLGFSVVELIAGLRSGSLALLADAGHMVTDGASLGISALAAWLAARPPSRRHTYGLGRAELLAALVNAVSMLVVVFMIASEAWQRLQSPGSIDGATVSVVAVIGLLINIVVAWILSRGERNLNVRAALLHVMGDALGSVAAIIAGAVIYFTGWTPIDPLLSILIGGLILASSVRLLREALHATLDGVPFAMDIEQIGLALAKVAGVREVHDLHVWPIAAERLALSAHVRLENLNDWPQALKELTAVAAKQGIEHVTFQPESVVMEQAIQFKTR
ncbi:MAG: cation diffusion facilitator family transporter [Azonexus sp.]|nr:cation diffusion facilitator family transporter [Azonexus sp.]MDZ4314205.1 cation diffusion facilitator family transporter [Azonexus sp.]